MDSTDRNHDPRRCAHCQRNRESSTDPLAHPAWVKDAIFYQIFPDRFARSTRVRKPLNLEPWDAPPTFHGYKGGDLLGVEDHLDWLTDLGVDAIYFNPVFRSASNHRYHTHDYYRVDPILGGNDAFDALLGACHDRGIRLVLDGVFNHSSRGFFRFHDVLENGERSPYLGWFYIKDWPLHPYSPNQPANYESWWGMRALPKFNTDNPEARDYLMRVGEYWVEKGIDGWRLDVPEEITSPGFWEEFRERTRAINPDCYIVGEIWGDASGWVNDGRRFDGTMNYPFTAATIAYAVGDRLDPATRLDNADYSVAPAIDSSAYRDRIEWIRSWYNDAAAASNLNLLDSHDTARILTIASGDVDSVVLSLVLLLTFPGAPSIYYGDEVGLEGGLDPDSRRGFPWDHEERWNRRILDTTKELIALRRAHPALRSTDYRVLWPLGSGDGSMAYAFERRSEDDRVVVVINAGDARESQAVPYPTLDARHAELLWGDAEVTLGEKQMRVSMAPRSAAIWALT